MHAKKIVHLICCVLSAGLLLLGLMLVATYGFNPPPWLLGVEVVTLSLLALVGGFSLARPSLTSLAAILRLRPVRGFVLVALGVSAMYLPPQLIASAVLLYFGIRLVWAEACDLAAAPAVSPDTVTVTAAEFTPPGGELPPARNGATLPAILRHSTPPARRSGRE